MEFINTFIMASIFYLLSYLWIMYVKHSNLHYLHVHDLSDLGVT